jgi:hypothetical protein
LFHFDERATDSALALAQPRHLRLQQLKAVISQSGAHRLVKASHLYKLASNWLCRKLIDQARLLGGMLEKGL